MHRLPVMFAEGYVADPFEDVLCLFERDVRFEMCAGSHANSTRNYRFRNYEREIKRMRRYYNQHRDEMYEKQKRRRVLKNSRGMT